LGGGGRLRGAWDGAQEGFVVVFDAELGQNGPILPNYGIKMGVWRVFLAEIAHFVKIWKKKLPHLFDFFEGWASAGGVGRGTGGVCGRF
jgi:hypothetical protein